MPLSHRLFSRIDEVDAAAWDALHDGPDDVFMDRRWLGVVERTVGAPVTAYRYLIVGDDTGRPVLSACLVETTLDSVLISSDWLRQLVGSVRLLVPQTLRLRSLQVGSPVHCGQSQLRLAPGVTSATALGYLVRLLERLAREMRARLILFSEHPDGDAASLAPLEALGFLRADSLPMYRFDGAFRSVEQFAAALRSHYRYKLRRSQRKFAASGLRTRTLEGAEILHLYSPDVHELYLLVSRRAQFRLDPLPHAFFVELVRCLPDRVALHVVFEGKTPIAFAWSLFDSRCCRNIFIGYDNQRPDQADLYFNLMLLQLDFALSRGAGRILLGQTAGEFKSRIGCAADRLALYVRPLGPDLALAQRLFRPWLFPTAEGPTARHLYRPPR